MTTTTGPTRVTGAVGTAHTRVEGRDKVTGAARYAGEIPFADLAHGWLVVSTVARGSVRSVESAPVLAMPGVLTVLHHGNAPRVDADYQGLLGRPDPIVALFQNDRVPCAGWPVALVVAETSEQAREAAEALVVRYETEPHDVEFTPDRPGTYTPEPRESMETEKGDLERELAASAVVVDARYSTPEEHHNPMEPHAATVRWDGGRLEVFDSNQGSKWVADELARLFSLDPASVRVLSEHIGGGFGSKGVRPHQVAAAMAATVLHRPVRVVLTRRQMFSLVGYRSPTAHRVRLGADAEGRLRAFGHEAQNVTSTVHEFVEQSAAFGRVMYDADAHRTANRLVRLDVPTPTWMRAPGEAPARSPWSPRWTSSPSGAASTRSCSGPATNLPPGPSPGCRSRAAICSPASRRAPAGSAGRSATRVRECAAKGAGCWGPARRRPPSPRASPPPPRP